jgi:multidrug resistance efflux pump
MTQPEALRVADAIELNVAMKADRLFAAAELRRLHELNQELVEALEALDECRGPFPAADAEINRAWKMVNAALAKARRTE